MKKEMNNTSNSPSSPVGGIRIMRELVWHLAEYESEWWVTGLIGDEIQVYCSVFGHRGIVVDPSDEERQQASRVDLLHPSVTKIVDAGYRWPDSSRVSITNPAPHVCSVGAAARSYCGFFLKALSWEDDLDKDRLSAMEGVVRKRMGQLALELDYLTYVPWFEAKRAALAP